MVGYKYNRTTMGQPTCANAQRLCFAETQTQYPQFSSTHACFANKKRFKQYPGILYEMGWCCLHM